ncbi:MAG: hypothetical protein CMH31_05460 [Micavibrio sp.]|nr:hypothetical protein [Micavibrio sp.]|tara:strand:- start:424 stop:1131 length:708 start_codon:yes stop_codon:yes gene_type:complete
MNSNAQKAPKEMFVGAPPEWSLNQPKSLLQQGWDFLGAPLRMVLLPDHLNEKMHFTSLRAERLANVLPQLEGRCLDIGAGDNMLLKLYQKKNSDDKAHPAHQSVGLDVEDWGSNCTIVENCKKLPFDDNSFDTVCFIACINHIPERVEALQETMRILKPGGKVIITMIGKVIGEIGHAIWWYSEDKHRDVHEEELMGMNSSHIIKLLKDTGFNDIDEQGFVYNLNRLYIAKKDAA